MTIWPKTRFPRILLVIALVVMVYSAAAYFGLPAALRYLLRNKAAAALQRPVTVGQISFNPYTLRLSIAGLSVRGRDGSGHFIDIDHADLRLSWTSLYRRALVLKDLKLKHPSIHVARTGPQRFDVSDLIDSFSQSGSSNRRSLWFAISNIEVDGGLIWFDDRVLQKEHRLDDIRLAIPFIANLPTDADKYVQPMLKMRVDGSPFVLMGKTKPFRGNLDSTVDVKVEALDIARFAEYAADMLPFRLKQAQLSSDLQLHFIEMPGQPELQIAGAATVDNVVANDSHDSALASVKQLRAVIAEFEPLAARLHLSSITIDSLSHQLVINQNGTTNLASLLGGNGVKAQPPAPSQKAGSLLAQSTQNPTRSPISATPPPLLNPMEAAPSSAGAGISAGPSPSGKNTTTSGSQFSLSADSIEIDNSMLDVVDRRGTAPVTLQFSELHLGVNNFSTTARTPAPYTFSARLKNGGGVRADGTLDYASSQATGKLAFDNLDLPALQGLASDFIAAKVVSGKFSGQTSLRVTFGDHINIHGEPAQIALDQVELHSQAQAQSVVGWKHLTGKIDRFDLASHQFVVSELLGESLHLAAVRDRQGNLNLASIVNTQPANQTGQPPASGNPWQYRIESLELKNADVQITDQAEQQPFSITISPVNLHLSSLTSDLTKPFRVEVDGSLAPRGIFKIAGETAISPFQSRLHVMADHIRLVALQPLVDSLLASNQVNAKITNGVLAVNGDAQTEYRAGTFDAGYQGDVALRGVGLSDRLTGVSFLRWYELSLSRVAVRYGPPRPSIRFGAVALSDFYARLILNSDGRLNVLDIVTNQAQPAVSITQPNVQQSVNTPASAAASPAEINLGSITLKNGEVNYLDDFIKPHYSAVLTEVEGKIGGFGTNSKKSADVSLAAKINQSSPVTISGSINPLAPMASLDLQANAAQVQLRPLTPYSAKYTGYPITGGTLSANVHYVLASRQLTATNHLLLNQLTVGERVENSSASNLPLRLAIAVLKDSQGRIDLKIPVSGSLSDPEFDLGHLIWAALVNVIVKAAASPFTALASALGSEHEDFSYVKFAPGYSTLSEDALNKLAKLTAALEKRSALKLQITGRVDPKLDEQGLREATLDEQVRRRKAEAERLNPTPAALQKMEVTPDEYDKYLWRVYKNADFSKPRDFVGMIKRLPPAEIKQSLLAHIKITDADLQRLAEARAAAVFQTLASRIDRSRLLVTPPKLNAEGISKGPTTRVDFALQ